MRKRTGTRPDSEDREATPVESRASPLSQRQANPYASPQAAGRAAPRDPEPGGLVPLPVALGNLIPLPVVFVSLMWLYSVLVIHPLFTDSPVTLAESFSRVPQWLAEGTGLLVVVGTPIVFALRSQGWLTPWRVMGTALVAIPAILGAATMLAFLAIGPPGFASKVKLALGSTAFYLVCFGPPALATSGVYAWLIGTYLATRRREPDP